MGACFCDSCMWAESCAAARTDEEYKFLKNKNNIFSDDCAAASDEYEVSETGFCDLYGVADAEHPCDYYEPDGILPDDLGIVEHDGRWYTYEEYDRLMAKLESEEYDDGFI